MVGEVEQLELLALPQEVHDHRTGQAETVAELHRVGNTSLGHMHRDKQDRTGQGHDIRGQDKQTTRDEPSRTVRGQTTRETAVAVAAVAVAVAVAAVAVAVAGAVTVATAVDGRRRSRREH